MKELKKKECKACGNEFTPFSTLSKVCSSGCALQYVTQENAKKEKRKKELEAKIERMKLKADKERIKKRTGKNGHYHNLKTALHYYVKHVLLCGEPCYTCGKPRAIGEKTKDFHVGHFVPGKEVDPRRFMLVNLRIQCYSCNVANSGMRAEYRLKLVEEMGIDYVEWLECEVNHKSLKEQYCPKEVYFQNQAALK